MPGSGLVNHTHRATANDRAYVGARGEARLMGISMFSPSRHAALARLARETGIFPVFEAEHGEVTAVTKIRHRVPVEDYLKPQRRFAHLFGTKGHPEMLSLIQADADKNIRRFKLLDDEVSA